MLTIRYQTTFKKDYKRIKNRGYDIRQLDTINVFKIKRAEDEEGQKMTAKAIEKMIIFYQGSLHDIEHFLKVWGYAKTIGNLEMLDDDTQETLELAAIVHDIACPLCREKYGSTAGPYQEKEGIPLAKEFYEEFDLSSERLERICYLVGHHHTFQDIRGLDYQILVEADFLVNASESSMSGKSIVNFKEKVFRTNAGIRLLDEIYDKAMTNQ